MAAIKAEFVTFRMPQTEDVKEGKPFGTFSGTLSFEDSMLVFGPPPMEYVRENDMAYEFLEWCIHGEML